MLDGQGTFWGPVIGNVFFICDVPAQYGRRYIIINHVGFREAKFCEDVLNFNRLCAQSYATLPLLHLPYRLPFRFTVLLLKFSSFLILSSAGKRCDVHTRGVYTAVLKITGQFPVLVNTDKENSEKEVCLASGAY